MTATDVDETTVERTYTGQELATLSGATYRQIDHWTRTTGHLPETAHGSGSRRRYTQTELDTVRLVVQLLRVGFVLDRAFAIAAALVTDDTYRAEFADIFQLEITVRPPAEPSTEGTPA